jgi:hypothetical protein
MEYVLLFKDGKTCICLHSDFEQHLKPLVEQVTKKGALHWDFQPSCHCDKSQQEHLNAAYYNRRGRFQLCRGAPVLALAYLKEALRLDRQNQAYRDDHGMALIAVRRFRQDLILESCLARGDSEPMLDDHGDEGAVFRADYLRVVHNTGSFARLEERLLEVITAANAAPSLGNGCATLHWSYSAGAGVDGIFRHELPHQVEGNSLPPIAEFPGSTIEERSPPGAWSGPTAVTRSSSMAITPMERKNSTKLVLKFWK